MSMFDRAVDFKKMAVELKDPTMRHPNLDFLYENLLKKFGYRDTSKVFSLPSGAMDPDQEFMILAQGGVCECKGDLQSHILAHLLHLASPALKADMESGKVHKDTARNLNLLIQQDMAKLATFMKDPQGAASQKLNSLGMSLPGAAK
jgi:hypothetical protein